MAAAAAPARKAAPAKRATARRAPAKRATARTAPVAPRRRSGPVRKPMPQRTVTARPALARVAQGSAALLLDRLLRGRAWIGLVGVLLAGIVFLNVSVLELNRGIAGTAAKSTALERTNSTLRQRVATLDSAERIQRMAEARGFRLPQPGDVTYVRPSSATARLAAKNITAPASVATSTTNTPTASTTPAATQTATPVTPSSVTPSSTTAAATPTTATPTTATPVAAAPTTTHATPAP
jgi:cell division protein FtsB